MKNIKKQRGITLIALIITIVILIILASISISQIKSNNIIGQTQNQKDKVDKLQDEYNKVIDGIKPEPDSNNGGSDCAHSYTTKVVEPTCTEQGYTTYTCSSCNYTYTGDYKDALGHKWDNTEGKITKEPTATTPGTRTFTCTVCGYKLNRDIPATGQQGGNSSSGSTTTCKHNNLYDIAYDVSDYLKSNHQHKLYAKCEDCGDQRVEITESCSFVIKKAVPSGSKGEWSYEICCDHCKNYHKFVVQEGRMLNNNEHTVYLKCMEHENCSTITFKEDHRIFWDDNKKKCDICEYDKEQHS